jgi:hypothetical protein
MDVFAVWEPTTNGDDVAFSDRFSWVGDEISLRIRVVLSGN